MKPNIERPVDTLIFITTGALALFFFYAAFFVEGSPPLAGILLIVGLLQLMFKAWEWSRYGRKATWSTWCRGSTLEACLMRTSFASVGLAHGWKHVSNGGSNFFLVFTICVGFIVILNVIGILKSLTSP